VSLPGLHEAPTRTGFESSRHSRLRTLRLRLRIQLELELARPMHMPMRNDQRKSSWNTALRLASQHTRNALPHDDYEPFLGTLLLAEYLWAWRSKVPL
jgi:hypothetical protein